MAGGLRSLWTNFSNGLSTVRIGLLEDFSQIVRRYWAYLIALTILLALAWTAHFEVETFGHGPTFILCFLAMMLLQRMFDWGGDKLGECIVEGHENRLDTDLPGFLVITASNAIEAALAIILLWQCQLRLLQSTIVGVVLLHMLLIPGTAFFYHGLHTYEQKLHPQYSNLNHSLSMIGILAITIPTMFFAALDRGAVVPGTNSGLPGSFVPLVSDHVRGDLLRISRGISVVLLVIYIFACMWRHGKPRDQPTVGSQDTPECDCHCRLHGESCECNAARHCVQHHPRCRCKCHKPARNECKCNGLKLRHWLTGVIVLAIAVVLMGTTAEFLVESTDVVLTITKIQTEWFGLIMLPFVSFSSDGASVIVDTTVAIVYYLQSYDVKANTGNVTETGGNTGFPKKRRTFRLWGNRWLTSEFAHGRPIDMSIQFTLFWTPLLVLLGWWLDRPMHMLFDFFEVGMLVGACLLLNYVTIDAKTNVSEGLTMISLYIMIATAAWWYPGQPQIADFLSCPASVASVVKSVEGSGMNATNI